MAENNLALSCLDDGRPSEAARHLTKAYDLNQRVGSLAYRASNLGNLGFAKFLIGDLEQARTLWEDTLIQHREAGNVIGVAISHTNLGNVSWQLGRLNLAEDHLMKSLRLLDEVGDRYNESYTKRVLASVLCDAGRTTEALRHAKEALSVIQGSGAATEEALARNALATVYCGLRRFEEAAAQYELARDTGRTNPQCMCETLIGLAIAQRGQGLPLEASKQARRALETARKTGYRVAEGKALTVLAQAELDQGQTGDARTYAELALENHRDTGHRLGIACTLVVLGGTSHADGDLQTALQQWQAASGIFDTVGVPVPTEVAEGLRRT